MLSKSDGIWSKDDLTFLPEEIRANWSRMQQSAESATGAIEKHALDDLKAHLKELGERREKRADTKAWILVRHPILSKDGFDRIGRRRMRIPR